MPLTHARCAARLSAGIRLVLLADGDRTLWGQAQITQSPGVEVNPEAASTMSDGVGVGLRHILCFEELMDDDLPFHAAAGEADERAIALCSSGIEADYLPTCLTARLRVILARF